MRDVEREMAGTVVGRGAGQQFETSRCGSTIQSASRSWQQQMRARERVVDDARRHEVEGMVVRSGLS